MSDYSKTTNFTAKDSLPSGNPSKLIKGSEFDTEFDALETAVATKANKIGSPVENDLVLQASDGDIKVAGWGFPNVNADITSSDEEMNFNDGAVAGTAVASKTVVLDASKDITGLNDVSAATYTASGAISGATLQVSSNSGGTPTANTLYTDNMITAWGYCAGGTTPSISYGFNIASVSYVTTGRYKITFTTAMDNTNFIVIGTAAGSFIVGCFPTLHNTTTTADILVYDTSGSPTNQEFSFQVIGGRA